MKIKIRLENPNPQLVRVARIITNGEAPDWVVHGLGHFGGFAEIGNDFPIGKLMEDVKKAVDTLLLYLPAFEHLPYGIQCPNHVAVVLAALPRVKEDLRKATSKNKKRGRPKNWKREVCAAVIVELWKLIHAKVRPRSFRLLEACNEYWRACGGEPIGEFDNPENWRRPVELALANNHGWIRDVLKVVRNVA